MRGSILIVEDNTDVAQVVKEYLHFLLKGNGQEIVTVHNVAEALAVIATRPVTLCITDLNLGVGPDGLELAKTLNRRSRRPWLVMMTSIDKTNEIKRCIDEGLVDDFLGKPFTIQQMQRILDAIELEGEQPIEIPEQPAPVMIVKK